MSHLGNGCATVSSTLIALVVFLTISTMAVEMVQTWSMSAAFLAGFLLSGYHAHFLLHLGLGHTLAAMFSFVGAVLACLLLNLWFMAGQRYVLEFLAWYEPTSAIAEWVHDTVFGISQERIDAAYRAGSHHGRFET